MAKPIGQLLKEAGVIREEHIQYAISVQKSVKKRLGDILLDLGFVTDYEVAEILAEQAQLEFLDLNSVSPSKEALSMIPKNFSMQNNILPVSIEDGKLIVAISDPYNDRAKAMVNRFAKGGVVYKVSPATELAKKIERFYYLAENPIEETISAMVNDVINGNAISVENLVNLIIEDAIDNGTSDIHINPSENVTLISYRIDGVLQLFHTMPISVHSRIVSTVKVRSGMDIASSNAPQDGGMSYEFLHEKFDFRVSTTPTLYGENLVIRILGGHSRQISLEQIGFGKTQLELVQKAVNEPFGIILVTGPTGSGKTTSLYAMLRKINTMEKNVLTIEDPVEFKIPLVHQVAVNQKANLTFSSAIRSFLRQDPDVMLIGEIRDEETATLAIRAALTGHLVLSTLHTNDAIGAISRLKDLGIGNFLLSSSITAIIAQRLVRKLCPFCKEEIELSVDDKKYLGVDIEKAYRHKGCDKCKNTGYSGRIAACEIVFIDDRIREMLADNASIVEVKRYLSDNNMKTMKDAVVDFVSEGLVDIDEAKRVFGV